MSPQPRKRFAQHWLRDEKILFQIVSAADLLPSDRILEIGPGKGILTRQILPYVQSVTAVEIDRDLCKQLRRQFRDTDNFHLLQGDILDLDLAQHFATLPEPFQHPNKVVANIPYNITGPILEKLLGTIAQPTSLSLDRIVLLVQKEIADRLSATPGSKVFGALSVRVQYLAECQAIVRVPAKAFYPPPKVDSQVVRLFPRAIDPPAENPKFLEHLINLGFASKRKMLRNNLKGAIDRDRLIDILEQLDLDPKVRAEDVGVSDWIEICNRLAK